MNIVWWLGKLASVSLSEYFSNVSQYSKLEFEKKVAKLKLMRQEFEEYDLLQINLLAASWQLWQKYSLSDEYRLAQESLNYFYDATQRGRENIAKFNEVWRSVLRKNPYKVEILKFKVGELLREPSNDENIALLLKYLADVKRNLQINDWANNIYTGIV